MLVVQPARVTFFVDAPVAIEVRPLRLNSARPSTRSARPVAADEVARTPIPSLTDVNPRTPHVPSPSTPTPPVPITPNSGESPHTPAPTKPLVGLATEYPYTPVSEVLAATPELLPALHRAGVTVVAISHDDRYIDEMDVPIRRLQMDEGRFTELSSVETG